MVNDRIFHLLLGSSSDTQYHYEVCDDAKPSIRALEEHGSRRVLFRLIPAPNEKDCFE
jgi:hypothetical protein